MEYWVGYSQASWSVPTFDEVMPEAAWYLELLLSRVNDVQSPPAVSELACLYELEMKIIRQKLLTSRNLKDLYT